MESKAGPASPHPVDPLSKELLGLPTCSDLIAMSPLPLLSSQQRRAFEPSYRHPIPSWNKAGRPLPLKAWARGLLLITGESELPFPAWCPGQAYWWSQSWVGNWVMALFLLVIQVLPVWPRVLWITEITKIATWFISHIGVLSSRRKPFPLFMSFKTNFLKLGTSSVLFTTDSQAPSTDPGHYKSSLNIY